MKTAAFSNLTFPRECLESVFLRAHYSLSVLIYIYIIYTYTNFMYKAALGQRIYIRSEKEILGMKKPATLGCSGP